MPPWSLPRLFRNDCMLLWKKIVKITYFILSLLICRIKTLCYLKTEDSCGNLCDKRLSCGEHFCREGRYYIKLNHSIVCHRGDCKPCDIKFNVFCFCGRETQERDSKKKYSCGRPCTKFYIYLILFLGNRMQTCLHVCRSMCHDGPCSNCKEKCNKVFSCGHHCERSTLYITILISSLS